MSNGHMHGVYDRHYIRELRAFLSTLFFSSLSFAVGLALPLLIALVGRLVGVGEIGEVVEVRIE